MLRWSDEQLAAYRQRRAPAAKPGRSKYGNRKTEVDGIVFDSKAEAARYIELRRLQSAGEITDLERQVPYVLDVNGIRVCRYIADFVYVDANLLRHVEDVKGVVTKEYALKKKLMRAVHGIEIEEIRKGRHAGKS